MAKPDTLDGSKLKITVAGLSDVGLMRSENQDRLFISKDKRILVVADGMGGHNGGSVASQLFVDWFETESKVKGPGLVNRKSIKTWSNRVVTQANAEIYKWGRTELDLWGMGTTGVVLIVGDDFVHCAHVGDSRIYRVRKGKLLQLTKDHSAVQDLIDSGDMREEERKGHPRSHIVTRFVGDVSVNVEHHAYKWQEGDLYLLASDGLTDIVEDAYIESVMASQMNVKRMCAELVDRVLVSGAPDNVTVLIASL
ncbi:MAG: protein phosphatase 2C domain-containing protein [Candidatus Melainabacteria bacterium]|nr:protein phosphatase 2C domain-containing protein [Candidatus Melainabacteria bacterium]